MTTVTANGEMLTTLSGVKELAEVRDSSGKVIGFFAPMAIKNAQAYANAAAHIDPAEVRRTKEAGNRAYSTQEVLDHLGSLEKR